MHSSAHWLAADAWAAAGAGAATVKVLLYDDNAAVDVVEEVVGGAGKRTPRRLHVTVEVVQAKVVQVRDQFHPGLSFLHVHSGIVRVHWHPKRRIADVQQTEVAIGRVRRPRHRSELPAAVFLYGGIDQR